MQAIEQWCYQAYLKLQRKVNRVSIKTLSVQEGSISYLEGGQGESVVLLHGFGADKDNWAPLCGYLSKHYKVIVPDIPGFGGSYMPESGFSILEQVKRIERFISAKGLTEYRVIGNSYGGYLAALLASRNSANVTQLTLINPLGVEKTEYTQVFQDILKGESPLLLPKNKSDLKALIAKCFVKPPFIPGFALSCMLRRAKSQCQVHEQLFYTTHKFNDGHIQFDYPLEELLAQTPVQTLTVWGAKDDILSVVGLATLRTLNNSHLQFECMENSGHLLHMESPKALFTLLTKQ
ncbi:alpha/beta hydrolase [Alteromonas sp. KUL49]|uniref:alpha/beta fold hydrolase n=1 Tax=Alteromonas sp. KUL49 TaxID=2480798 RepID=UPI0010FFC306|nr:alpha/beta hydrolase [Alteromonas sp. KUL49]GEA10615.1 lipase [Alteromonas sp. KUL49]